MKKIVESLLFMNYMYSFLVKDIDVRFGVR